MQLDLFAWAAPSPPPVWHGAPRFGWRQYWPCACGRTHCGVVLTYPWSMLGLRHWRVSAAAAGEAAE